MSIERITIENGEEFEYDPERDGDEPCEECSSEGVEVFHFNSDYYDGLESRKGLDCE